MEREPLLSVHALKTHFDTKTGVVRAVDGVSFDVPRDQTVCVVGESGCGKSVTALSVLQVVGKPGRVVGGRIGYRRADGSLVDIAGLDPRGAAIRKLRGKEISMVFQEPMSSLSPVHTVGFQIIETLRLHLRLSRSDAESRGVELLAQVGIPDPGSRLRSYTFELSGGLRQRAMIALALACGPRLLIADEPTTALDVTTQADILDLLQELQVRAGMALLFITHDLCVVAEIADQVVVMYLGTVVERGTVDAVYHDPRHPYTRALLRSIPFFGSAGRGRLATIRGGVPLPTERPAGCPFHPRCELKMPICETVPPPTVAVSDGHTVSCHAVKGAAYLESSGAPGGQEGQGLDG